MFQTISGMEIKTIMFLAIKAALKPQLGSKKGQRCESRACTVDLHMLMYKITEEIVSSEIVTG